MPIDFSLESFAARHNGPNTQETKQMLERINSKSMDQLMGETVPAGIRLSRPLNLPDALSERDFLRHLKEIGSRNTIFSSYIGLGYYDTIVPNVILRNILENPGWYTAYTPYQAEIAQGRLEALINFQTVISDLTAMPIANASLLDEATAAAEAVSMLYGKRPASKKNAHTFFVDEDCLPQTRDVIFTRAESQGISIEVGSLDSLDVTSGKYFGFLVQYPSASGALRNVKGLVTAAREHEIYSVFAADLLALTIVTPPGEMGADVVVGTSQRFGVPMGYGGPHAAFLATTEEFKRVIPGRIIGVTQDAEGNPAYRMALQTREQHIRREKATSNICTAQVLLAVMAGMYAVYHGPAGLQKIARRVHGFAVAAAASLSKMGLRIVHSSFFDTILVDLSGMDYTTTDVKRVAESKKINLHFIDETHLSIAFDETKTQNELISLLSVFAECGSGSAIPDISEILKTTEVALPDSLRRNSTFLEHPVFNSYQSEHEMLRYIKKLENKDLSLVHSMISLGSCTMKLNATAEMIPVTWPEFAHLHPFAPVEQAKGYSELFFNLENWLQEITGFEKISLQPNSGAQGEYAGLMVIRAYHKHRGESHRNVTIVPSSAHGTNPASAVMAGMKVVVTRCDENGNIDTADLKEKAELYKNELAALMVTYPSTHGVFEESIRQICEIIHENGGLVYMDGANMNAQVGLTSPAEIGADVCHLNMHKTFCIPHGGGGPGMGPIGVNSKLAPFLPGNPIIQTGGSEAITSISAAPWGSAGILAISYAYILMMGSEGLTNATKYAILNANYMMERLKHHFPVLYTGRNGRSAHEFILDLRPFKQSAGIEAVDVAKRLMDYGFHAPTMSFPVAGTLMIEPTESESKAELDRFCDAMIGIRNEISEIEKGLYSKEENVLKHAPHTIRVMLSDEWDRPYSREKAVFPLPHQRYDKFWPSVSRVDDAYGDRNLICNCIPVEEYA